jgi:hypothetical protein
MRGIVFAVLFITSISAEDGVVDVFDDAVVHDIRLTVNPSDWRKLRDNYLDNTYYECAFEWRGQIIEGAGIRSRGNGSRSGIKPSLRVDFDRFEPDQKFMGLKSIVLKNNAQDETMLKERVVMRLFRRLGIAAPREAHARLYVNGSYAGLYLIVEPVDKRFLKLHFDDNDGYLYQYNLGDPWSFEYLGPDPSRYVPSPFKPETREKEDNHGPIVEMIRTVNEASDEEFEQKVSEHLDLGRYITQLGGENYVAEFDGLLAMNNYFLYRLPAEKIFHHLPWDKDGAFTWSSRSIWLHTDLNVLSRRALAQPRLRTAYLEILALAQAFAGDAGGWMESEISSYYRQIRTAAREDSFKQCNPGPKPCSNEEFEAGVENLLKFARERSEFIRGELAEAGFDFRAVTPRLAAGGVFVTDQPVTLPGERLPDNLENVQVLVNGFRAEVLSVSPDSISIELPGQTREGRHPVTVISDGVVSNTIQIQVVTP